MRTSSLRLVDEPVPSDTPTFSTAYMHKTSTESPVILLPGREQNYLWTFLQLPWQPLNWDRGSLPWQHHSEPSWPWQIPQLCEESAALVWQHTGSRRRQMGWNKSDTWPEERYGSATSTKMKNGSLHFVPKRTLLFLLWCSSGSTMCITLCTVLFFLCTNQSVFRSCFDPRLPFSPGVFRSWAANHAWCLHSRYWTNREWLLGEHLNWSE